MNGFWSGCLIAVGALVLMLGGLCTGLGLLFGEPSLSWIPMILAGGVLLLIGFVFREPPEPPRRRSSPTMPAGLAEAEQRPTPPDGTADAEE